VKVTFRGYGANLASTRLRAIIPAQQLYKQYHVATGADWLIIGKHAWNWEQETQGYGRVCFDVCDDWFGRKWDQHYREACAKADLVTCSSHYLQTVIARETGKQAVCIPEPYEQPERPARCHPSILWFGFRDNLIDLSPLLDDLKRWPLEIVSNVEHPEVTEWSPESQSEAFDRAGLVIIPTGKSMAKSGNRAVDSLRRGLYPICGNLPSYSDLGVWQGDIIRGIEWALSHRNEVVRRIKAAQHYIRSEYSPEQIGSLWYEALNERGSAQVHQENPDSVGAASS
jgi:hypothetical protein